MDFNGKLTQRFLLPKQIGTDEAVADEIRSSSNVDGRSINDQLRFLLKLGLHYRRIQMGQAFLPPSAHHAAQERTRERTGEGIPNAQTRTNTHAPEMKPPVRMRRSA